MHKKIYLALARGKWAEVPVSIIKFKIIFR
jgi:hypothetical protein